MWPLERRSEAVLRIGRERVELWDARADARVGWAAIEQPLDVAALEQAITQALLARQPALRRVDVVVESAWSPVLALPAGPWRWNLASQLTGLLRHRLETLYGDAADPVAAWNLRVDYRPGDANAIGYGLPAKVRAAIESAVQAQGTSVTAFQPAIAWGRAAVDRRGLPPTGWWLWLEQDRTILAHLAGGRVSALQPAAPALVAGIDAQRLVEVEATRLGIEAPGPVCISGWQAPASLPTGMRWVPLMPPRTQPAAGQPVEAAR